MGLSVVDTLPDPDAFPPARAAADATQPFRVDFALTGADRKGRSDLTNHQEVDPPTASTAGKSSGPADERPLPQSW